MRIMNTGFDRFNDAYGRGWIPDGSHVTVGEKSYTVLKGGNLMPYPTGDCEVSAKEAIGGKPWYATEEVLTPA